MTRPWREFMSGAQKNSRRAERRSYSWLASVHHHSRARAFAPSMNKQPVLLFRTLSFITSSPSSPFPLVFPPTVSVCLSVVPFRLPRFSVSRSLFFLLFSRRKKEKRTLLIYDKTDETILSYSFLVEILRNPSRRRETKGEKKENARQWTNTRHYARNLRDVSRRSNGFRVAVIKKNQVRFFLPNDRAMT